jgi:hypothetical protein
MWPEQTIAAGDDRGEFLPVALDQRLHDAVLKKSQTLFYSGVVRYRDTFGTEHETGFAFRYLVSDFQLPGMPIGWFTPFGGPAYNYWT